VFISQTRLIRTVTTAQGDPGEVTRWLGIVRDWDVMWASIPLAQRPPVADRGAYVFHYDLRCSIEATVLGLARGDSRYVLCFYDVWHTPADRIAALPPVLRESQGLRLGRRLPAADVRAILRQSIRDRIERVSLFGGMGDLRDPRYVALADEDDPEGILADARELELTRDIDTAVSNPSGVALRTNPETGQ
jgi:hypothetical protein